MPDKNEKLTELRSTQSKLRKQLREKRVDRLVATEPSDQDALDKQIDALNEQIDTLSDQISLKLLKSPKPTNNDSVSVGETS